METLFFPDISTASFPIYGFNYTMKYAILGRHDRKERIPVKKNWLVLSLSGLLSLLLLGHFAMTFLYLSPSNPFRYKHWAHIQNYMSPYFSQNWYLFAPNPVNQHQNLQIRIKLLTPEGKTVQTKWKDLSTPMIRKLQKNRFSPQQRVYEYQSTAMHTYVYGEKADQKGAENHLRLFVDYYLKTQPRPEGQIVSYQMRVVTNKFPRFSKRDLPDSKGTFSYQYSNWFPY
jgi:hypothetical protein